MTTQDFFAYLACLFADEPDDAGLLRTLARKVPS